MNVFTAKQPIILGRETENKVTTIQFPVAKWIENYGAGGTFHLFHKRFKDAEAYPVPTTCDGTNVYWTPTETDLAIMGRGEAQLDYCFGIHGQTGFRKACSEIFETRVERSIEAGEETPEPYQPWVSQIEGYADRAEAASASATGSAATATAQASAASDHAEDAEEFKNEAAAIMGLATFQINADTGELVVTYPTPYAGATFAINNGYLEVTTA